MHTISSAAQQQHAALHANVDPHRYTSHCWHHKHKAAAVAAPPAQSRQSRAAAAAAVEECQPLPLPGCSTTRNNKLQPGTHSHISTPSTASRQQQDQQQHSSVLPPGVEQHQLPRHVALIMDGNSRWATRQGLPALVGHERGVAALKSAVVAAREWGIPALTVYAFSLENWQRDAAEVTFLMNLFQSALQQQLPELQSNGVKLQFMGQLHRLPPALQQQAAACEAATSGNSGLLLTVAVSYSAQEDMVQAMQQLAQQVQAGQLTPEQITPALISQHLSSAVVTAGVGPPDLCIRTSGEQRLSNFMLFESAYTELCFLDVLWPAFTKKHFASALQQYAQRQRRYGRRK